MNPVDAILEAVILASQRTPFRGRGGGYTNLPKERQKDATGLEKAKAEAADYERFFGFFREHDVRAALEHRCVLDFGSGYGGRTQTPLIDGNLLLMTFVTSGWGKNSAPRHRYHAWDKNTGELVWVSTPGGMPADMNTQSAPTVAEIAMGASWCQRWPARSRRSESRLPIPAKRIIVKRITE